LFFETKLSKDGNISCNSCHNLKTYGVDNLSFSPGDTKVLGGRNSPSAIYAFLHNIQFWDGRAKDVEEQAGGPILNPVEHNIPSESFLEKRLRADVEYQKLFKEVFPSEKEPITFANITKAIGAFERQLKPVSRYDKWVDGDDKALNADEKAGLKVFIDKGCITCHSGNVFGGKMFQKFGLFDDYWKHTKSKKIDNGVYDLSKKEGDKYFFKVPSLRNVAMTHPYFHDGSVTQLEDAVRVMSEVQLANKLNDQEIKSVVLFLKSLTAEVDAKYQQ
jgi:cytochrome c peroxidase